MEQAGQSYTKELSALEALGFKAYTPQDQTNDGLSQYDTELQQWIGMARMLSGAGIVAGSWLAGAGACTATAGFGCGAGAALAATGGALGLTEAQQGAQEWNHPDQEDPAQRVADAFHPDTHPGERNLLKERSQELAMVIGENLAAGVVMKLGLKLAKTSEVPGPVSKDKGDVPENKGSEILRLSNGLDEIRLDKVRNTEFFGGDIKTLRNPGPQIVQLPDGSFKRLKVDIIQSTIPGDYQTAIKFFDAVSGKKTNVDFSKLEQGPKELARFEIKNRVFTLRGSSKELPTVEVKTFLDNKIIREKIRFGDIQ